jgi:hypothetical protein
MPNLMFTHLLARELMNVLVQKGFENEGALELTSDAI